MTKGPWATAGAAALVLASSGAHAAPPAGVDPLLKQAQFWRERGRGDRAMDAYHRVLAIDPENAAAKAGLATLDRPPAAAPVEPAPHITLAARPHRKRSRDPSGPSRVAGFSALARNDLSAASAAFQAALEISKTDHDALGGLGLVRLRQHKFQEASELLGAASAGRGPGKWADALRSANFYAGLNAAMAAHSAGDDADAEAKARALVDQGFDPDGSAHGLLGDILQGSRRYADAAQSYEAAARAASDPGATEGFQAKAVRAHAEQAAAEGESARAEAILSAGVDRFSRDPWLRHDLALIFLSEGREPEARATIEPLRSATEAEALFAAALVLAQDDKPDAASDLMARVPATELQAPMRDLLVRLSVARAVGRAKVLAAQGRSDAALEGLRAVAANPELPVAALGALADAFASLDDTTMAADLADRAASLPKAEPSDYFAVVAVLGRTGEIKAGAALMTRLTPGDEAKPSPEVCRLNAVFAAASADWLRLHQQYATAFNMLRQAWAWAPKDPDILGATGRLYQSAKLNVQAAKVFAMLVKVQPDNVDAWMGLAQTSLGAGLKDQAHGAAAEAVRRSPGNAQVLFRAAKIEEARGDKKLALVYLREAEQVLSRATLLAEDSAFPTANPFSNQGADEILPGAASGAGLVNVGRPMGRSGVGLSAQTRLTPASPIYVASAAGGAPGNDFAADVPTKGAPASQPTDPPGDPTVATIEREVADLSDADGPVVSGTVALRSRSGEAGLSALNALSADATAHITLGTAALSVSVIPVVLEAGSLSASAQSRYGFNATPAAQALVTGSTATLAAVSAPQASGAALAAKLAEGPITAEVGVTPLGFQDVNLTGALRFKVKPTDTTTVDVYAERAPVTDSVLAYAGEKDPRSGRAWGGVVRNQAGVSYSFDSGGMGAYVQASAKDYQGASVKQNYAGEVNAGAYVTVLQDDRSHLTVGANVNVQGYRYDEDFFTFGNGGYFSPQSFASISVPIRYATRFGPWSLALDLSPGVQAFSEASAPIYPTDYAAQTVLSALNASTPLVRSTYDSAAASGAAVFGDAKASYPIAPGALISGEVSYNSFGAFNELQVLLTMKKTFGGASR